MEQRINTTEIAIAETGHSTTALITDKKVHVIQEPGIDFRRDHVTTTEITQTAGVTPLGLVSRETVRTQETGVTTLDITGAFHATALTHVYQREEASRTTIFHSLGGLELNERTAPVTTESLSVETAGVKNLNEFFPQSTPAPKSNDYKTDILHAALGAGLVTAVILAFPSKVNQKTESRTAPPTPAVRESAHATRQPALYAEIHKQIAADEFKGISVVAGHHVQTELGRALDAGNARLVVARLGDAAYEKFNGPGHNAETRKEGAKLYGEAAQIATENKLINPNAQSAVRSAAWLEGTHYKAYLTADAK